MRLTLQANSLSTTEHDLKLKLGQILNNICDEIDIIRNTGPNIEVDCKWNMFKTFSTNVKVLITNKFDLLGPSVGLRLVDIQEGLSNEYSLRM